MTRSPATTIRHDAELLLVVLFWAFNLVVVKRCLGEMQPLAFNILRFGWAAVLLAGLTFYLEGWPRLDRRDLGRMILLELIGHTLYQLCFVLGLARTTASSTALIFGTTPVVVSLLTRLAGHERVEWAHATGTLLAFAGVFLIVKGSAPAPSGGAAAPGEATWLGNLLVMAAVLFWSAYTVLSRDLLRRHSPLRVTALTLGMGTLMMIPAAIPSVKAQDWPSVSWQAWAGAAYSCVFALVISYILWYRSVRAVGNVRTALYSNLVPVFGAVFGVWLLHERLSSGVGAGAACILGGIVLSRWHEARRRRAWSAEAAEEAGPA